MIINSQGWSLILVFCYFIDYFYIYRFGEPSDSKRLIGQSYTKLYKAIQIIAILLLFELLRLLKNKKDRLENLSMTWIVWVGATGFEPAT